MGNWSKTKLLTNLVVVVAVLVIGAGVVMAARGSNVVPFTSSSGDSRSADATAQRDQNEFQAHGMIQTITFDQGTTSSGNLEFLPDGQPATVIVDFTAQTHIQVTGGLQTNIAVRIEGTRQSDGSVLAKEIQDNAAVADDDNQNGNGHEDQTIPGVIQSVDTTAKTFVFLPDGSTDTLTIAYDTHTEIEHENHAPALAAGRHVVLEVVKRADGSFYAREIKSGQDDGNGHDGNSGDDGGHGGSGSGNDGSGGGNEGSGGDNSGSGSGSSGSGDGSGQ
jgi:cytochrome c-type biogenesis protein CcmE